MWKKILAAGGTIAIALGLVTLTASPALAHDTSVTSSISCTSADSATITWSVKNDWNTGSKVTDVDGNAAHKVSPNPRNDQYDAHETKTYTQTVSQSDVGTTFTLEIEMTWSDHTVRTGSSSLKVTSDAFTCGDNTDHKIDICHATPPQNAKNGWNPISVDYDSIVKAHGHDSDAMDIIPPFDYTKNGQSHHYAGKNWTAGGQQILNNDCKLPAAPPGPSYGDAVCTAAGQAGSASVTIPSNVEGAQYWIKTWSGSYATIAQGTTATYPVGTWVEVKVTTLPGYELSTSLNVEFPWHKLEGVDASDCVVPGIPAWSDSVCTTPGHSSQASYTIPSTSHVVYKVNGKVVSGTVDVNSFPTSVTITAEPAHGYAFPSGTTASWTHDFTSPGDCLVAVTPAAHFTAAICTGPGTSTDPSYTIESGTGVIYVVKINGEISANNTPGTYPVGKTANVVIDATPAAGYKFSDGATVHWETTFVANPCLSKADLTPPDLEFTDAVCTGAGTSTDGSYVIPATTGVQYQVLKNRKWQNVSADEYTVTRSGTVHIRAVAQDGYTLDPASTTSWSHTFHSAGKCLVEANPVKPQFDDAVCTGPGQSGDASYTIEAATGVQYEVLVTRGSFPHIQKVSLDLDAAPGQYDLAPGDTVTVTATPRHGYYFDTFLQVKVWWFTASESDCLQTVTPVEPSIDDQVCTVDLDGAGTLTDGAIHITPVTGVKYTIDGSDATDGANPVTPGDHIVAAIALSGYTLDASYDGPWTLTSKAADPCGDLVTHPLVLPQVTDPQGCGPTGTFTLSNNLGVADAVIWTIDGKPAAPGTHTLAAGTTAHIHAEANDPDYGLDGTKQDWTVSFTDPVTCGDLKTLALTGGELPTGLIGGGVLLLVAGLSLIAVRELRRRRGEA